MKNQNPGGASGLADVSENNAAARKFGVMSSRGLSSRPSRSVGKGKSLRPMRMGVRALSFNDSDANQNEKKSSED